MKKSLLFTGCIIASVFVQGQVYNAGDIYVPSGGSNYLAGGFTNSATGTLTNAGTVYIDQNVVNDGITGYDGGTLQLMGNSAQTLSGTSTLKTTDVVFNNDAGITITKGLSLSGTATFTNGLVTASSAAEPLEFNPGGTGATALAVSGASDASHVNGYVRQLGTGSFVYPVGDVSKFQPVGANLSANASGMTCKYYAADAGMAPFSTTGLGGTTPLLNYNDYEYWDFSPVSSATGNVTIYYDTYKNVGIGMDYNTALKVAHLTGGKWANEGGTVTGAKSAGSVSSASGITTWSPFTLGTISSTTPLPVTLHNFEANSANCSTTLLWESGEEAGLSEYLVQSSADTKVFTTISTVRPRGGNSKYSYAVVPVSTKAYYRIGMHEVDGSYTYSNIISQTTDCNAGFYRIYPNPLIGNVLNVDIAGYGTDIKMAMTDGLGRNMLASKLVNGHNSIETGSLAPGFYLVEIVGDGTKREVYKLFVGKWSY